MRRGNDYLSAPSDAEIRRACEIYCDIYEPSREMSAGGKRMKISRGNRGDAIRAVLEDFLSGRERQARQLTRAEIQRRAEASVHFQAMTHPQKITPPPRIPNERE